MFLRNVRSVLHCIDMQNILSKVRIRWDFLVAGVLLFIALFTKSCEP